MILKLVWWLVFGILWLIFILGTVLRRQAARFLLVILGLWLTTGSFFLLPWIQFTPWRYADSLTLDLVSEAALTLLEMADIIGKLPKALGFLSKFLSPTGLFTCIFMPSLNVGARVAVAFAALAGCIGLATSLIGELSGTLEVKRFTGAIQSLFALLTLILLVVNLNTLDGWATVGRFPSSLLPILTGAELGLGPWMACGGLIVLIISGGWAIGGTKDKTAGKDDESSYDYYWESI